VETFERFLTDKGKGDGGSSGNYRRHTERELDRFLAWARGKVMTRERLATRVVERHHPDGHPRGSVPRCPVLRPRRDRHVGLRPVSRRLRVRQLHRPDLLLVSRILGRLGVETGYLARNYARESDAEDPLPDNDGRRPGDQPAWDSTDRDRITRHVDEQAEAAIDAWFDIEVDVDDRGDLESEAVREKARARRKAIAAARDRVLVYILCYTGLRGGAGFRRPRRRPARSGRPPLAARLVRRQGRDRVPEEPAVDGGLAPGPGSRAAGTLQRSSSTQARTGRSFRRCTAQRSPSTSRRASGRRASTPTR